MNLCEKHRPKRLADLRGQEFARKSLSAFCKAPYPVAFLFAGDTGVGKTSAAFALANDLGCSLEAHELGGITEIASGEQTAESVRDAMRRLSYRPFYGSGWKVLIVNECDMMHKATETIWLDALENLPAYTVVVFTTNDPGKLASRFKDRCEVIEFASDFASLRDAAKQLVAEIWQAETGQMVPPAIALDHVVVNGQLSFRRLVQFLAPMVRCA